jgi:uncharacterized protein
MYLDTCILVKLLTPEPETVWLERELRGHALATSELALVEVKSALFAKERAGAIQGVHRRRAEAKFAEMIDSEVLLLVELSTRVLRRAAHVIEVCHPQVPLRALDALHVASCDFASDFPLCTTDARMHAAAREMRLPVFPETLPLNP